MCSISVIIPNYNHAPFLKQRIESVLKQTYQNFELIILDDCSTDNSKEIIETYRNHSKVKQIVYNKKNSGSPFKQWKKGVELSDGEYIWIAESDDWASSFFLEKTLERMRQDEEVGIVFCGNYWVSPDGSMGKDLCIHNNSFIKEGITEIKEFLVKVNTVQNVSSVLFRKKFFKRVTKSYSKYKACGDWVLYAEILVNSKIVFIQEKMNYFRFYHNNISNNSARNGLWEYEGIDVLAIAKKSVRFSRREKIDLIGYWVNKIRAQRTRTIPLSFTKCAYIHFKLFSFAPGPYLMRLLQPEGRSKSNIIKSW